MPAIERYPIFNGSGIPRSDVCWGCGARATTSNAAWPVCAICKEENVGIDTEGSTRSMVRQRAIEAESSEVERLRAVLAFYAEQGNYVPAGIAPTIWTDNGSRARAALNVCGLGN